jgi:hypothetical protein
MANGSSNEKFLDIASSQQQFFSNYNTALSAIAEADPELYSKIFIKVLAAAAQIAAFLSPDPVEGAINKLAAMLQADVIALEAYDAAIELESRTTTLNGLVSDTSTCLGLLQTAVDHPDQYPPGTLIVPVQECLNKFLPDNDQVWNITYTTADIQKIYWSDQGRESVCFYLLVSGGFPPSTDDASYGTQQPPLNDDGSVFEYRITLPMYLSVISAFLAIGRTLDPNFLTSAQPDLVKATNKLQSIHDKLMTAGNGLTPLSPPSSMGDSVQNLACPEPVDGVPPGRPAVQLVYGPLPPARDHAQMPPVVGAVIEYGAVEKFSGISSIGDGYQLNFAGDVADPALYNKLQIRVLKRMKDVYFATGLASVWRTINHLKALTGGLISNAPSFADWSMREVLGKAKLPSQSGAQSLRGLAAFIVRTQPFDTQYSDTFPHVTVSFKDLLTNFPN